MKITVATNFTIAIITNSYSARYLIARYLNLSVNALPVEEQIVNN